MRTVFVSCLFLAACGSLPTTSGELCDDLVRAQCSWSERCVGASWTDADDTKCSVALMEVCCGEDDDAFGRCTDVVDLPTNWTASTWSACMKAIPDASCDAESAVDEACPDLF